MYSLVSSSPRVLEPRCMACSHHSTRLLWIILTLLISRAALFLTAGDYGAMIRILDILDQHWFLPDKISMAKEFGLGLANYKDQDYITAKPYFDALFEISIEYRSLGNQALEAIYLGVIGTVQGCREAFYNSSNNL